MTHTAEQLPVLSAKDLKGYDRRRITLIREMESYGWRGRRGSKHHIVMRAPDGTTTTAISPKVISPKNEHHVAADFRRWLRQQGQALEAQPEIETEPVVPMSWPAADATSTLVAFTALHDYGPLRAARTEPPLRADVTPEPEPVDTAPEPVVAVLRNTQQLCGLCEKPFATLQALSVHRVRVHSKVACEVCDSPMSPSNLARHLRKHVEDIGTHEQAMREVIQLRALVSRLRDESAEWQSMAEACEAEYAELTSGMRALLEG
jgi:hypothetical protein